MPGEMLIMPLHEREVVRHQIDDCVFADRDLTRPVPKYRFPEEGTLADRLRTRGWQMPAYTLTGSASDIAVQRILVRLGVSRDLASLLLDDFRDAVAHFRKHPVTVSMTKRESGGFSHL